MSKDANNSLALLIPAAGFGNRVGRPHAKELFIHPETLKPLINKSLDCAKSLNCVAIVITRSEKKDLLAYLDAERSLGTNIETLVIEPSKEWPDSLLQSKHLWCEKNIVVLPDTEFLPTDAVDKMVSELDHCDVAYGLFETDNPKTFGMLGQKNGNWWMCEKPETKLSECDDSAWGLFGFRKHTGEAVLKMHLDSTFDHRWRQLDFQVRTTKLEKFVDLTR
jgi:hypothetical protein